MTEINLNIRCISKPWNEKYRPKDLNNLAQQSNIQKIAEHGKLTDKMPHLLLYGPPGCGKTTTGLAICKKFYTDESLTDLENQRIMAERVLELNASDERGIQFVKGQIKSFAEQTITSRVNIPNFKIIVLDECDAMTNESQFALRRIMEDYAKNTRFILICNYVNKIIIPIRSRNLMIRYQHITVGEMDKIIQGIAEKESLSIDDAFVSRLHAITRGDLRKGVNILEQCSNMFPDMSIDSLNECTGMITNEFFNHIMETINNKESSITDLHNLANDFTNESYLISSLIQDLFDHILNMKIDGLMKANMINVIANADASSNKGSNEMMILHYLFVMLHSLKHSL